MSESVIRDLDTRVKTLERKIEDILWIIASNSASVPLRNRERLPDVAQSVPQNPVPPQGPPAPRPDPEPTDRPPASRPDPEPKDRPTAPAPAGGPVDVQGPRPGPVATVPNANVPFQVPNGSRVSAVSDVAHAEIHPPDRHAGSVLGLGTRRWMLGLG